MEKGITLGLALTWLFGSTAQADEAVVTRLEDYGYGVQQFVQKSFQGQIAAPPENPVRITFQSTPPGAGESFSVQRGGATAFQLREVSATSAIQGSIIDASPDPVAALISEELTRRGIAVQMKEPRFVIQSGFIRFYGIGVHANDRYGCVAGGVSLTNNNGSGSYAQEMTVAWQQASVCFVNDGYYRREGSAWVEVTGQELARVLEPEPPAKVVLASPTDLIAAAKSGNLVELQQQLAAFVDVDHQNKDGGTALMYSSAAGHLDIVRVLLQHDAAVDQLANDGGTALMLAAHYGRNEIVDALLAQGADVDIQSRDGRTALMFAASQNRAAIVSTLLAHGADTTLKDEEGDRALEFAKNEVVVKLLAAAGSTTETRMGKEVALAETRESESASAVATEAVDLEDATATASGIADVGEAPAQGAVVVRSTFEGGRVVEAEGSVTGGSDDADSLECVTGMYIEAKWQGEAMVVGRYGPVILRPGMTKDDVDELCEMNRVPVEKITPDEWRIGRLTRDVYIFVDGKLERTRFCP